MSKIGLEASDKQMKEILQRVKAKSFEKKGLLGEAEFKDIVEEVVNSVGQIAGRG